MLVIGYTALCAGGRAGDHLSQRHRQRREPRRPDPGGGADRLEEAGGPGRPAGDAENQGVVFTAQTVEGESKTYQVPLASATPDSVASTQRAWQVGACRSLPPAGRDLPPLPAQRGRRFCPPTRAGESLDSILDQVEADLAWDPVEPTWETDDTTLHLTRGTPAAGWTGRPSRDRFWTPWAAATWWN